MGKNPTSGNSRHGSGFLRHALVFVFLFFCCQPLAVHSAVHWFKVITPIPAFQNISPYFLNEKIGFVFAPSSSTLPVYRTFDGGATWKVSFNQPQAISQIYFVTLAHGYLAGSKGLYETKDTGNTWQVIYPNYYFSSVYAAGGKIFATINNGGLVSYQYNGTQWTKLKLKANYFCGNQDSLIYATDIVSGTLWYSTDLGTKWASNILDRSTLGLFCFPHCSDLLRTNAGANDLYPITYSSDYGKSWQTYFAPESGAWFSGNACAVYISNAGSANGPIRSVNRGRNWLYINGPDFTEIDDHDFRNLSVVGNGAVVYACDINGILWKTTDGGDGSMSLNTYAPSLTLKSNLPITGSTLNSVRCDTPRYLFTMQNFSCNSYHLDDLHIEGMDSNEYQYTLIKHYSCSGLPDTLILSLMPDSSGIRPILIREHYITDEFRTYDTSFSFTLNVAPPIDPVLLLRSHTLDTTLRTIDFGTKAICFGGGLDTVQLTNLSCSSIIINDIHLETDSLSKNDFSLTEISPYDLNIRTSPNRILLHYDPQSAGAKSGKIIIKTSIGNDTILFFGNAIADTAKLIVEKNDTVRFDPKPLCIAGGRDTIVLSNPSCFNVKIKNIRFEPDPLSANDFFLTTSGPATLRIDAASRKIFLLFHPMSSGTKTGKIIIETDLRNDTIYVIADVIEDSRTVSSRCENLQSPICDSVDGFVYLSNRSCREMTLDAITIPSPYHLLLVRLPLTFESGDSLKLPVRFIPSQRGSSTVTANATISIYQPLGTVQFDTTFVLSAFGLHGASSYTLSQVAAAFDSVHFCDSAKQRIVLHSTGCDSLPLSNISISGNPDFAYSILSTQPAALAVGDSIVMDIVVHPTSMGNKSATVTITLSDSSKVTIPLSTTIIRSLRILSSDAGNILDFGKQFICDNTDTTITLLNSGCDTVRVSGTNLQGSGFGISNSFPIIIPPGKSVPITVQTTLDTIGGTILNSAELTFTSDADITVAPITLMRSYNYPHSVHLKLDANATPFTSLSVLKIKLKAPPSEVTDLHSIDLSVDYNANMLGYLPKSSSLQSTDGKVFHLSGSPMISSASDSTIGEIAFEVYLTKDTATTVTLTNIIFNSDPKFTECVAVPQQTGIDLQYINGCGDPFIRTIMQGQLLHLSIRPNPVQDEIILDLNSPISQDEKIEIFDALGMKVFSNERNIAIGSNSIHLDTKSLPVGMYLVRIGATSQSFVKVK